MSHVFITGDRHGDYKDIEQFCLKWNTSKDDLLIVLGDNGVNYWGLHRDKKLKNYLSSLPISFFMIKGNHDQRPSLKLYHYIENPHPLICGECLIEDNYPSLIFSKMYGQYDFCNEQKWISAFVLGGAYSADKWYRLEMQERGYNCYRWFPDEQMTKQEMDTIDNIIQKYKTPYDCILSHTCPYKYIPRDMFIPAIDQSKVDDTMEHWLDTIEENTLYNRWYCGHWHTDRTIDKIRFMYYDVMELK